MKVVARAAAAARWVRLTATETAGSPESGMGPRNGRTGIGRAGGTEMKWRLDIRAQRAVLHHQGGGDANLHLQVLYSTTHHLEKLV